MLQQPVKECPLCPRRATAVISAPPQIRAVASENGLASRFQLCDLEAMSVARPNGRGPGGSLVNPWIFMCTCHTSWTVTRLPTGSPWLASLFVEIMDCYHPASLLCNACDKSRWYVSAHVVTTWLNLAHAIFPQNFWGSCHIGDHPHEQRAGPRRDPEFEPSCDGCLRVCSSDARCLGTRRLLQPPTRFAEVVGHQALEFGIFGSYQYHVDPQGSAPESQPPRTS